MPNNVVVQYVYDNANRVTGITYCRGSCTIPANVLGNLTYAYDAAGNRTKVGGTFARTSLPAAVASAVYNAANQLTQWGGTTTLMYDNNGNVTFDGTNGYIWNAQNQLGIIHTVGASATFVYDGLGRRQTKTIGGSTTGFLYDGVNPVLLTGAPSVSIWGGLGIDEFFMQGQGPDPRIFLTDALGSTIALTDSAGTVQTEYTYEPFGKATVTGAASTNSFQFTGRENDGTGLYYYRARYYHPTFQRFISEDPPTHAYGQGPEMWAPVPYLKFTHGSVMTADSMVNQVDPIFAVKAAQSSGQAFPISQLALAQLSCGRAPGGPDYGNLYAYVSNSPIDATDPSGLGRPAECVQYVHDCLKGNNTYACAAIFPCFFGGSNCIRNCLLDDYRGGCTSFECQIVSHLKCISRCGGPSL